MDAILVLAVAVGLAAAYWFLSFRDDAEIAVDQLRELERDAGRATVAIGATIAKRMIDEHRRLP